MLINNNFLNRIVDIKEILKILELSPKIYIQFDSFFATVSLFKRPTRQISCLSSLPTQD